MNYLRSTTLRTALVDYRAELMRMMIKYPMTYCGHKSIIQEIDDVLMSIEGNITTVCVTPNTCNPNP